MLVVVERLPVLVTVKVGSTKEVGAEVEVEPLAELLVEVLVANVGATSEV